MSRQMCPHGFDLNDGPCEDCDPVAALRDAKERIERLEDSVSEYASLVHSDYCTSTCCSRCVSAHALLGMDSPGEADQ